MAKQIEDTKTPDMIGEPKKRGRPSTGKAMSGAERQRRLRERAKSAVWGDGDLMAALLHLPMSGLLEELGHAERAGSVEIVRRICDEIVSRTKARRVQRTQDAGA